MEQYKVIGLAVVGADDGAMIYDLLTSRQEAHDICSILNSGIGPEWDAVSEALDKLIVVKEIRE